MTDETCAALESGRMLLIGTPQNGGEGPLKLYARLLSGDLGFEWDGESELWVLMTNRRMNRLRLFHIDAYGCSLTVRGLFARGALRASLKRACEGVSSLTRRELLLLLQKGSAPLGTPEVFSALKNSM
jgi:hypothetical protein